MSRIALLRSIAAAVLSFVCAAAAAASAQPVLTRDGDRVTVRATRIATPMKIDGRLDMRSTSKCPPSQNTSAGPNDGARSPSSPNRG